MLADLRRYFLSGFFTLIPIGLSVFVVWWFVALVDRTLAPVLDAALGRHFPGVGLLAAMLAILFAGVLTSHVLGERLLELIEEAFQRIPVFKTVYVTIKQMVDAFSPENQTSFKSVVLVAYPRAGAYSLGFVTNEVALEGAQGGRRELVAVYIPTNHVYFGEIVMFPKAEVIAAGMSVQQGIQCSLSAGAALPEVLGRQGGG